MKKTNAKKEQYPTMTNEEYRLELQNLFAKIEDSKILRYFYIFVSEKLKGML